MSQLEQICDSSQARRTLAGDLQEAAGREQALRKRLPEADVLAAKVPGFEREICSPP